MAAYNETLSAEATPETHKSSKVPQRLLRLFALYENLLRFVMPMCSRLPRPNPESPIVSSNNIVDVSGVGLKQFWNLKGHMQDASVLATAHYPETLDRIFVSSLLCPRVNIANYITDHWRAGILPYCLGLDQAVVRPRDHI